MTIDDYISYILQTTCAEDLENLYSRNFTSPEVIDESLRDLAGLLEKGSEITKAQVKHMMETEVENGATIFDYILSKISVEILFNFLTSIRSKLDEMEQSELPDMGKCYDVVTAQIRQNIEAASAIDQIITKHLIKSEVEEL